MPGRRAWPVAALVVLCGCGLGEYESKMAEAEKRLKRHEEEERLLGPAIVIPTRDDGKGNKEPVANLHLRLPQGLKTQPANENDPRTRGAARLYTYPASSGTFKFAELAAAGEQKDFLSDVLGLYDQTTTPKRSKRELRPPGRPALSFDTTEFENGDLFYSVNRHTADKEQVVVVYCLPKAQKAAAARAIELSLESFAVGPLADRLRASRPSPLKVPRK